VCVRVRSIGNNQLEGQLPSLPPILTFLYVSRVHVDAVTCNVRRVQECGHQSFQRNTAAIDAVRVDLSVIKRCYESSYIQDDLINVFTK
jgi:hypothetical protein